MSRPTFRKLSTTQVISRTGLSPSVADLSRSFRYVLCYHLQASPISLATTIGISVDVFSSSYLDVSVRPVRLSTLCIQIEIPFGGFPHSEISGSKLICQLPEAYRRLSRPSSPIIAKASTTCSYSLDPITLTLLAKHRSQNQGMIDWSFTNRVMPNNLNFFKLNIR